MEGRGVLEGWNESRAYSLSSRSTWISIALIPPLCEKSHPSFPSNTTEGVHLDRGYVADEDTSIYNPGLTLLTESEKERLVEAVITARREGLQKNAWSENNEFAFEFLREKLDPFHMTELRGFLSFAPFYAGLLYLGVLGVQQFARGAFQIAYLVGVAAFFLPIVALIAAGV